MKDDAPALFGRLFLIYDPLINQITHHIPRLLYKAVLRVKIVKNQFIVNYCPSPELASHHLASAASFHSQYSLIEVLHLQITKLLQICKGAAQAFRCHTKDLRKSSRLMGKRILPGPNTHGFWS